MEVDCFLPKEDGMVSVSHWPIVFSVNVEIGMG